MKRRRNIVDVNNTKDVKSEATTAMKASRKKSKRAVEKAEEERKNGGGGDETGPAAAVDGLVSWEESPPWLSGVVDEQMSWGSIWLPVWDVEYYMGDSCNNYMFSDVVWDDDIWNLKSIDKVPSA